MGARNFGLHLKDHDNDKRTDVVFGKGSLDVVSVLRALREVKFTGYIALEYEANPPIRWPTCVPVWTFFGSPSASWVRLPGYR